MSRYSIKDLENLSGIKAHTIRIWEKRYSLFTPKRTNTNIRYYDDSQLRKLLNIATLLNKSHKISHIASYSEDEVNQLLEEITSELNNTDSISLALINQLISSGMEYDEAGFEKAFSSAILRYGLSETYNTILYPMLIRVGLLWSKSNIAPAQEHFISNLVKQKIYTALDAIPLPQVQKETWILFLPEEEDHEIGLLYASLLLRQKNKKVVYLGQRVPLQNILSVVETTGTCNLLFFLVRDHPFENIRIAVESLRQNTNVNNIYASANSGIRSKFESINNLIWIRSVEDLEKKV